MSLSIYIVLHSTITTLLSHLLTRSRSIICTGLWSILTWKALHAHVKHCMRIWSTACSREALDAHMKHSMHAHVKHRMRIWSTACSREALDAHMKHSMHAHVKHYMRTWSITCAREALHAHMKHSMHAHVKHYMRTWSIHTWVLQVHIWCISQNLIRAHLLIKDKYLYSIVLFVIQ